VAVFGRDRDENGLVEAAADELDLLAVDELAQEIEKFRMIEVKPLQKRAGIVHPETNRRMAKQQVEERKVAAGIGLRVDVVEIADGLVGVDEKNEMKLGHEGAP
jgi:hypothetical protein